MVLLLRSGSGPVDTARVTSPSTRHSGRRIPATIVVSLLSSLSFMAAASAAGTGTTVPGAPNCPMFPADNVWNTPISSLPVNAQSSTWMASMDGSSAFLHPDYGPSGDPSNPYGIPFTVVPAGQPLVSVSFQYADESDPGPYPFGPNTPIEGGQSATGDRHAIMVDPSTCTLYELYDANYSANGSTAGSGAIWNLNSDALRPAGWTSADAAGLPILPGLVDYDEVASGSMNHAIRFTAECTDEAYIWPARHEAGQADTACPPMGARFRLAASFTLPASTCAQMCQTVITTMKNYGLILADNGSNWYFQGTADTRWTDTDVDQLKQIPASAFEAVDESSLMVNANSGQAVQRTPMAPPTTLVPPTPPTTAKPTPAATVVSTTTTTVIAPPSPPSTVALAIAHRTEIPGGSPAGAGGVAALGASLGATASARKGPEHGLGSLVWLAILVGVLAVVAGPAVAVRGARRMSRKAP